MELFFQNEISIFELYFEFLFPEHNNLFHICFAEMYYFQLNFYFKTKDIFENLNPKS